jgi:hypothetical protein
MQSFGGAALLVGALLISRSIVDPILIKRS